VSAGRAQNAPTGSLRDALWKAAERMAPSMNSQAVANTVCALAKLNMPSVRSLLDCLLAAVERMAPRMIHGSSKSISCTTLLGIILQVGR
jgi:hypothetical protein